MVVTEYEAASAIAEAAELANAQAKEMLVADGLAVAVAATETSGKDTRVYDGHMPDDTGVHLDPAARA